MFKHIFTSLIIGNFCMVACNSQDAEDADNMAIHGSSSLVPVSELSSSDANPANMEKMPTFSVGLLRSENKINKNVCTVNYLGNFKGYDYAITAAHCFPELENLGKLSTDCKATIQWYAGKTEGVQPQLVSKCNTVISSYGLAKTQEERDNSDFAILEMQNSLAKLKAVEFIPENVKGGDNSKLFLFGFMGNETKLYFSNNKECAWSTVISSTINTYADNFFVHNCDTMPGSSGALILTNIAGEQKAISMHLGEYKKGQNYSLNIHVIKKFLQSTLQITK